MITMTDSSGTLRVGYVGTIDSAQDASSHVSTVTKPVLYEFNVLQVIFDDTDQVTQTFLLLFQMLKEREAE